MPSVPVLPTAPTARRRALVVGSVLALPALLVGCTSASESGDGGPAPIAVTATETTCTLSSTTAAAGVVTFKVTNSGEVMNEFYVYDEAGTTILAEVENIGPGLSRELTAELPAGTVTTACRPNGTGDGIRAPFTVTAGTASPVPARTRSRARSRTTAASSSPSRPRCSPARSSS